MQSSPRFVAFLNMMRVNYVCSISEVNNVIYPLLWCAVGMQIKSQAPVRIKEIIVITYATRWLTFFVIIMRAGPVIKRIKVLEVESRRPLQIGVENSTHWWWHNVTIKNNCCVVVRMQVQTVWQSDSISPRYLRNLQINILNSFSPRQEGRFSTLGSQKEDIFL